jgi:hypothetical protein
MGGPLLYSSGSPNNTASFYSNSSSYVNATTYVPLEDGPAGSPILPTYYNHQPVAVTSINDMGGTYNAPVRLTNYFSTAILTDSSCGFARTLLPVGGSGLLRTCNGGSPVVFRNHANSADVPAMTTNSSDQLVLGGAAGVLFNGPQIGHAATHGAAPTTRSAGCAIAKASNDRNGTINLSAGATACAVVFAGAYTAPVITLTPSTGSILPYVSAKSTRGFTVTVAAASGSVDYHVEDVQ